MDLRVGEIGRLVPPLYKNWARITAAPPPRATMAFAGVFKTLPAVGLLVGVAVELGVEGTPTMMVVPGMVVAGMVVAGMGIPIVMVGTGEEAEGEASDAEEEGLAAEATAKKAAITTEVAVNFMFGKVLVGLGWVEGVRCEERKSWRVIMKKELERGRASFYRNEDIWRGLIYYGHYTTIAWDCLTATRSVGSLSIAFIHNTHFLQGRGRLPRSDDKVAFEREQK